MPAPAQIARFLADVGGTTVKDKDLRTRYVENGPDPDYWRKIDPPERCSVRIYHRAKPGERGLAMCGARVLGRKCLYFNSEEAARLLGFQKCLECSWD